MACCFVTVNGKRFKRPGLSILLAYQLSQVNLCIQWAMIHVETKVCFHTIVHCSLLIIDPVPIQGRITQVKQKNSADAIAAKCYYHRDCSVLKSAKAFGAGASDIHDRIMAWLWEGQKRVPERSNAFAHKQLYGAPWTDDMMI